MVFTMDKVLVPTVDGNCQAFLPDNDKNVGILTTCVQFHLQLLQSVAPVQLAAYHSAYCTEYCG